MTRLATCYSILLTAFSVWTLPAQDQRPVVRAPTVADGTLSWKFREGQVFEIVLTQHVTLNTIMGTAQKVDSIRGVHEMALTVNSVDADGVATTTSTIDRIIVKSASPGRRTQFDSSSKEQYEGIAAQVSEAIAPIIGVGITRTISSSGNISNVNVPASMFEGAQPGSRAAEIFNADTLKEMTSKANMVFPDDPLAPGDTWNTTSEMILAGANINTETRFEYLGVTEDDGKPLHVIRGSIAMSFPDSVLDMGIELTESDSTFMCYFDGNAGRVAKSVFDERAKFESESDGQNLLQIINRNMTITYHEKE